MTCVAISVILGMFLILNMIVEHSITCPINTIKICFYRSNNVTSNWILGPAKLFPTKFLVRVQLPAWFCR